MSSREISESTGISICKDALPFIKHPIRVRVVYQPITMHNQPILLPNNLLRANESVVSIIRCYILTASTKPVHEILTYNCPRSPRYHLKNFSLNNFSRQYIHSVILLITLRNSLPSPSICLSILCFRTTGYLACHPLNHQMMRLQHQEMPLLLIRSDLCHSSLMSNL